MCSPPPDTWRRGRECVRSTTSPEVNANPAPPAEATGGYAKHSWNAHGPPPANAIATWQPSSGASPDASAKKAALAVGHSILVIAWHLLHNNATYTDLGADWFIRRTDNNTRRRDRLITELQGMGYRVSLEKAAS